MSLLITQKLTLPHNNARTLTGKAVATNLILKQLIRSFKQVDRCYYIFTPD